MRPLLPRAPAEPSGAAATQLGQVRSARRLRCERELRQALARDELRLHYQPIVGLRTGDLFGFEALARWDHPTAGSVTAGEFIPVAEDLGLIDDLGASLLARACRDAYLWNRTASRDVGVAVNVSASQLAAPDVLHRISSALDASGLDPSLLTIEITETAAVSDATVWRGVLEAIRRRGVGVAIDDFGVGYSCLDSLHRLPIDGFKIPRTFVVGLDGTPGDAASVAIVTAMLALGRALHLDVVAEGIETPEQRDRLADLGCERGQGFLFARPMPDEQVVEYLRRRAPAPGRPSPGGRECTFGDGTTPRSTPTVAAPT